MRRREVIAGVGAAASGLLVRPWAADAQQQGLRRVAILSAGPDDVGGRARVATFGQTLAATGWIEGQHIEIGRWWGNNDTDQIRAAARQIIAWSPHAALVTTSRVLLEWQRATTAIPTVFVGVSEPLRFVASLSRPGGPLTGFSNIELSLVGKWLQALKEVAPSVARVAMVMHADNASLSSYVPIFDAAAQAVGLEASTVPVREATDLERALGEVGTRPNGSVLFPGDTFTNSLLDLIARSTIRERLPAIGAVREFAAAGSLMSYGHDPIEQYRGAATYVDRILKGERAGELPVQAPTKYEFVINLKAARQLAIDIPPTVLARADEVIE